MSLLHDNTRSAVRFFAGLLSIILALAMGVLPIAQELHLAFASHSHRFCLEHRQYEDVFSPKGDKQPSTIPEKRENQNTTYADALPGAGTHIRCTISNQVAQSFRVGPIGESGLWRLVGPTLCCPHHELARNSVAILARAPKQSPPLPLS